MSDTNSNAFLGNLLSEHDYELHRATLLSQISSAISSVAAFITFSIDENDNASTSNYSGRAIGSKTKLRKRRYMDEYFGSMDHRLFHRKYRMSKDTFYALLDIIKDQLPNTGEKRKRGAVPNGPITKAARLSMALRYCAGGDPLNIGDLHGVNTDEVPKK